MRASISVILLTEAKANSRCCLGTSLVFAPSSLLPLRPLCHYQLAPKRPEHLPSWPLTESLWHFIMPGSKRRALTPEYLPGQSSAIETAMGVSTHTAFAAWQRSSQRAVRGTQGTAARMGRSAPGEWRRIHRLQHRLHSG